MNDRGVSTVVGYVLALGIIALLSMTLFVSMAGFVDGEREWNQRDGLVVVGSGIAGDIEAVDRLASDRPVESLVLERSVPSHIAGSTYKIAISPEGENRLHLTADETDVEVTVHYREDIDVESTTVSSGKLVIEYDASDDRVVVRNG